MPLLTTVPSHRYTPTCVSTLTTHTASQPTNQLQEHFYFSLLTIHTATSPLSPSPHHPQELLAAVAPKKANWDLKRDLEPRLAKLERRTQRALLQMLQEEERSAFAEQGGAQD